MREPVERGRVKPRAKQLAERPAFQPFGQRREVHGHRRQPLPLPGHGGGTAPLEAEPLQVGRGGE